MAEPEPDAAAPEPPAKPKPPAGLPPLTEWLAALGAADAEPTVRENGFESVEELVAGRLDEGDLKDLGFGRMKPRKAVLQALRKLAPRRRVVHSAEVEARIREWDDTGARPRPPRRRRHSAKPKGTPLEQAEAVLRQAARRADPYQKPWLTLSAALAEGDAGLMAGLPPDGSVTAEWFAAIVETKLQLKLGEEKLALLFDKYAEAPPEPPPPPPPPAENAGEEGAAEPEPQPPPPEPQPALLPYQRFAKALFSVDDGSEARPGRRLLSGAQAKSRRPSSAPSRGRPGVYPSTRESVRRKPTPLSVS